MADNKRLELQEKLEKILGSKNVYFQPPPSVMMNYPCIRYKKAGASHKRADNKLYNFTQRYEVIVMDYDPDSQIALEILNSFEMCNLESPYVVNNLHHDVLSLYY